MSTSESGWNGLRSGAGILGFLMGTGLAIWSAVSVMGQVQEGERSAGDKNWMTEARGAMRLGQWEEAERWILKGMAEEPGHAAVYLLRGQWFIAQGQGSNAVAALDQALALNGELAEAYQWRGAEQFKLGNIEASILDFDAYLRRRPGEEPHHWQRGIAYYYAGRFEEGRKQFELHQTVNSHDVENAVWHFLCVARLSGVEVAKEKLIPIRGDTRVPMREVHELFAGQLGPERVLEAVAEGTSSPAAERQGRFYAHLYLGLYYEAQGDEPNVRTHILKAAELSEPGNYMGAVARVHAARLDHRSTGTGARK